ncbi:hypothetical protein ACO0K7_13845 [Undibacterium sp. Ji67W]|uniref:hypothetical protein n=1 Tax=Undibacterium sp. Ji67W TaxID=3413042 RepID=UPI003BF2D011
MSGGVASLSAIATVGAKAGINAILNNDKVFFTIQTFRFEGARANPLVHKFIQVAQDSANISTKSLKKAQKCMKKDIAGKVTVIKLVFAKQSQFIQTLRQKSASLGGICGLPGSLISSLKEILK